MSRQEGLPILGMNSMSVEFFLDTNILVYTFDPTDHAKQTRALSLVENALEHQTGVISYQVVQELLNVATRKFAHPLTPQQARRYLETVLEPLCSVYASVPLYRKAIDVQERWRHGFYDSLIIASALQAGCHTLYSEDLHDGQAIESCGIPRYRACWETSAVSSLNKTCPYGTIVFIDNACSSSFSICTLTASLTILCC